MEMGSWLMGGLAGIAVLGFLFFMLKGDSFD